jgi:hypothetical protein
MSTVPAAVAVLGARRHARPLLLVSAVLVLMGLAILGSVAGGQHSAPSPVAFADIPAGYLTAYQRAAARYGIDWAILAAIGSIECDHGRNPASGCNPPGTVNVAGATGPMQFLGSTWRRGTAAMAVPAIGPPTRTTADGYAADGDGDGLADIWNPADAIAGAARLLRANGAPGDYRRAVFAYNHADWYVRDIFALAATYRGAVTSAPLQLADRATAVAAVLGNPRIQLTGVQRLDFASGLIDPRVAVLLASIGRAHSLVITALRSDHSYLTASGFVSNHALGRAVDIGAVDGELCTGTRTGACGRLAVQLAAIAGPLRSTELIYCFDPDGSASPDAFARADHCDHIHAGYDD